VRPSRTSGFSSCQVLWLIAGRSASSAAVCRASSFMCATHLSSHQNWKPPSLLETKNADQLPTSDPAREVVRICFSRHWAPLLQITFPPSTILTTKKLFCWCNSSRTILSPRKKIESPGKLLLARETMSVAHEFTAPRSNSSDGMSYKGSTRHRHLRIVYNNCVKPPSMVQVI
jgi:hypothetical protein